MLHIQKDEVRTSAHTNELCKLIIRQRVERSYRNIVAFQQDDFRVKSLPRLRRRGCRTVRYREGLRSPWINAQHGGGLVHRRPQPEIQQRKSYAGHRTCRNEPSMEEKSLQDISES